MASVTVRDIEKSFGSVKVLNGVSIDIKDGEFIVLVGPSGCGKSTLLRIISGLEQQNSGNIQINHKIVDDLHASRRDLAMVFQSYALYPHLSVEKNISVPLRMRRLNFFQRFPFLGSFIPGAKKGLASIQKDVDEVTETLGIKHLLDRKPGQLSGGQRQRVAVGRAMVRHPQAFLMDEPLSNLDAELRVHMRAEIAQLHRRLKSTFIYVTHDQAEAMTMADRVAVMMDGNLLQVDTPSNVYSDPSDIRVAEFIGSPKINILPGEVDGRGNISVGRKKLIGITSAITKTKIKVGVRPEALSLVDAKSTGLPCSIVHHENLGSEAYFHADLDLGVSVICRMEASSLDNFTTGQKAKIAIDPKNSLLFGEDGQRIALQASTRSKSGMAKAKVAKRTRKKK
ncbi:MAG: ABC transporter ATP-binding protein [Pseudomonadota bacterium]|nr:ABC transporter ATP-binding protein [Pseudomonadota bacterium]